MKNILRIGTVVTVATITLLNVPKSASAASLWGNFVWKVGDKVGTAEFHLEGVLSKDPLNGNGGTITNVPKGADGSVFDEIAVGNWSKTFNVQADGSVVKQVDIEYDSNTVGILFRDEIFESGAILDANDNVFATITDAKHTIPEPSSTLGLQALGSLGAVSLLLRTKKQQEQSAKKQPVQGNTIDVNPNS